MRVGCCPGTLSGVPAEIFIISAYITMCWLWDIQGFGQARLDGWRFIYLEEARAKKTRAKSFPELVYLTESLHQKMSIRRISYQKNYDCPIIEISSYWHFLMKRFRQKIFSVVLLPLHSTPRNSTLDGAFRISPRKRNAHNSPQRPHWWTRQCPSTQAVSNLIPTTHSSVAGECHILRLMTIGTQ